MEIINLIFIGFNLDLFLCCQGEDYYIVILIFEWFLGVCIYYFCDLKNWLLVSILLDCVLMLDMKGNLDFGGIWVLCLSYVDGKFWLFYIDVKIVDLLWKNGCNFFVIVFFIEGLWSELILMGNGGFDLFLFYDDDGCKYYIYCLWGLCYYSNLYNIIVLQVFDLQIGMFLFECKMLFIGMLFCYIEGGRYSICGYCCCGIGMG